MKREKSCGAVVYDNLDGELSVLLVKHKNGGHWSFPKGHMENDETEVETAFREILEETGITAKIDDSFRNVVTYSPQKGVTKDVVYFAARPEKRTPTAQPEEIMEIQWASQHSARQMITYETDKQVFDKFWKYINDDKVK